jgi:hypothetical protein
VLAPERQGREAARPYGSDTDPSGWMGVLRRLDLSESQAASLARRAEIHGVAFQTELIASGLRREDEIFRAIAAELDVRYAASVDPGRILPGETDAVPLLRRSMTKAPRSSCWRPTASPSNGLPATWRPDLPSGNGCASCALRC